MEEKTFTYSNAIVKVYIPDLSQEERKRRMEILKKATQGLMIDLMKKGNNINDKDIKKVES